MNYFVVGSEEFLVTSLAKRHLIAEPMTAEEVSFHYKWIRSKADGTALALPNAVRFHNSLLIWSFDEYDIDIHKALLKIFDESTKWHSQAVAHCKANLSIPHTIRGRASVIREPTSKRRTRFLTFDGWANSLMNK